MKKCKPFEKQLVAYIHGELSGTQAHALEAHLQACAACRAELAARRATLDLLGHALENAPAPERIAARHRLPVRATRRERLAEAWYSPQFRAGLVTAAAFSLFLFLSFSFVMVTVIQKEEKAFSASFKTDDADQARPRLEAKKLQMPAGSADAPQPKPQLRQRVVAKSPKSEFAEIPMPSPAPILDAGMAAASGASAGALGRGLLQQTDYFGVQKQAVPEFNTEQYDRIVDNTFKTALENPLSTFSIDVDRAAYANVRRFLANNQLPPPDAVRIEEMVNYFTYDYPQPQGGDPFIVSTELADCPWNPAYQLALIGIQGVRIETKNLPPNNLVFLLDVSGSMDSPDKLPLLKSALRLLVNELRPQDRVGIVVYAGAAGCVLEPTSDKTRVLEAIDRLSAGGSTAGGAGIELAYKKAQESFIKKGNNRVILATDGDFNVGVSSDGALTRLVEEKRKSGIFLTVLGFGTGNLKDSRMEKLADKGNGNYAYIDDILEAKKVLVSEMGGTLVTIAKDVKVQVEFNPAQVKAYRLVGYENRLLAKEDFNDDTKDAGELGAGHTVTALYEIIPAGSDEPVPVAGALKYQRTKLNKSGELMTVNLRYKQPNSDVSKLISQAVSADDCESIEATGNLRFASSVAEFGLLLRGSEFKGSASYGAVIERAKESKGADSEGYRAEFIRLVEKAQLLDSAP